MTLHLSVTGNENDDRLDKILKNLLYLSFIAQLMGMKDLSVLFKSKTHF